MLNMVRDACLKYLLSPTCSPLGPERVLWDPTGGQLTLSRGWAVGYQGSLPGGGGP